MSQINSNIKDDFQVVLLLSCFVGHPVYNQKVFLNPLRYELVFCPELTTHKFRSETENF